MVVPYEPAPMTATLMNGIVEPGGWWMVDGEMVKTYDEPLNG